MSSFGESHNIDSTEVEGSNAETGQTGTPKCQRKRKAMAPRSEVWGHFSKFLNDAKEQKARCNYCGKEFCCDPKKHGTKALNTHLTSCKSYTPNIDMSQTLINLQPAGKGQEGEGSTLTSWKFDQEAIRRALIRMVIIDELPFIFVEGEGFRSFMSVACPRFHIPSRWTVSRDCFKLYFNEKANLKQFLRNSSDRVCITTDTWTSIQRINYMVVTAHFIDNDWNLNKKILSFCPISSHRGETIGKALESCLLEWGIDKVMTITVDNASSNDAAIDYLKRKFSTSGSNVLDGKFLHMRCVAHIINLVVVDGLKEVGESVSRIRAAVRYVRQSPSRSKLFKECVEDENLKSKSLLCLDVSTRWNSTYSMLDTALKF